MTASRRTRRGLPLAALTCALWGLSSSLFGFGLGCGSDADLATGYLGDTSEPVDPPRADVPERYNPWFCLDQPPPELPAPRPPDQVVGFVQAVVDWITLEPLAGRGLTATLCAGSLFNCAIPLAPPYVVREGMLGNTQLPMGASGVPVFEGFDGFIKFEILTPPGPPFPPSALSYIPVSYFLGRPIAGELTQGPPVYMLQRSSWATLLQQSFPQLDPGLVDASGTLIAYAFDCLGELVNDARIEISVAGESTDGLTPFLLPASRIPIAQPAGPLITSESGLVGYLGVPPGAVQLRAFHGDDTAPFSTTELGVVAGGMSMAILLPAAFDNNPNVLSIPPSF